MTRIASTRRCSHCSRSDFEVMHRLHQQGLIHDPVGKAKSVWLMPEGLVRGRELAQRLFGAASRRRDGRDARPPRIRGLRLAAPRPVEGFGRASATVHAAWMELPRIEGRQRRGIRRRWRSLGHLVATERSAKHPMQRYRDIQADSGVAAYEIGPGSIAVRFHRGGTYLYDGRAPGAAHVAEMQRRARAGAGLNTYINQHVRGHFAAKLD